MKHVGIAPKRFIFNQIIFDYPLIKIFLMAEINERESMSQVLDKYIVDLDCADKILICL